MRGSSTKVKLEPREPGGAAITCPARLPAGVQIVRQDRVVIDARADASARAASETLSHLLARILNQLSLSAWLPSAALVLLVGLALEFGAAVDENPDLGTAITGTLVRLGNIKLAGLVLLVLVVVVSTMLTQAFAFGAIRVLEGYWGPSSIAERLANSRADRHRRKRHRLARRYQKMVERGYQALLEDIESEERERARTDEPPRFNEAMHQLLAEQVLGLPLPDDFKISETDRTLVEELDWRVASSDNVERRELNLRRRLADYPQQSSHVLPTRLGNVLRRREDDTGRQEIEGFVEAVFEDLPFGLQLAHDEQRTRLDLYCSMVFVISISTLAAVVRFGFEHWEYQVGTVALGLTLAWVVYFAALSTARHYGSVLIAIARHIDNNASRGSLLSRARRRLTLR